MLPTFNTNHSPALSPHYYTHHWILSLQPVVFAELHQKTSTFSFPKQTDRRMILSILILKTIHNLKILQSNTIYWLVENLLTKAKQRTALPPPAHQIKIHQNFPNFICIISLINNLNFQNNFFFYKQSFLFQNLKMKKALFSSNICPAVAKNKTKSKCLCFSYKLHFKNLWSYIFFHVWDWEIN